MFYVIKKPSSGSRELVRLREKVSSGDCSYYVYIHYKNNKPIYIGKGKVCEKDNRDSMQRFYSNSGREYKVQKIVDKIVVVDFYNNEELAYSVEEALTNILKEYATWAYYNKKSANRLTEVQKEKLLSTHLGGHLSDSTKEKLSLAFRGEKHPLYGLKGGDNPSSKKVIGIKIDGTNIIILKAIIDGKKLGFTPGGISNCCRGKIASSKGYVWYYYSDLFDIYFNQ